MAHGSGALANDASQRRLTLGIDGTYLAEIGTDTWNDGATVSMHAAWSVSNHFALGARRMSSGITRGAEADLFAGLLEWRPLAGSFYVELGAGAANRRLAEEAKSRWVFAQEGRIGNRWTLPFGMTLGLTYLGFLHARSEFAPFTLIGGEFGWRIFGP